MKTTKKPVIMVIEDEDLLLEAISKKLKLTDLDVVACSDGKQALTYLQNFDQKPDAIWLDYYLGDMDGIVFMQKLNKHKEFSDIPVVVVSNSASPDKVKTMTSLGAKEYFIKAEHRLDELVGVIKKYAQK